MRGFYIPLPPPPCAGIVEGYKERKQQGEEKDIALEEGDINPLQEGLSNKPPGNGDGTG